MTQQPTLAEELQRLLAKTGFNRTRLIEESRGLLPSTTLHAWLTGGSARVQNPDGIAVIASILGLNRIESDRLARAAGLGSLDRMLNELSPAVRPRTLRWGVLYRNNLPVPVSRFIGRGAAVRDIAELLGAWDHRLVTLYGSAGSGKTRLALEVARQLRDAFPDGLFLMRLADVPGPEQVAAVILRVLGVSTQPRVEPVEQLCEFLSERRLLLILDNFEHLLPARELVAQVLATAPLLRVLTTSRVPLGLADEVEWHVEPLALPPSDANVRVALASAAVELFQDRARAVLPWFSVSDANAGDVVQLCRDLDGLPLAIELVAARIDVAGTTALRTRVSGRQVLDVPGPLDSEPRLANLRDAINWSYRLLDPDDAILLNQLSVFAGGWTTRDAGAVCATADEDVSIALSRLQRSSLIEREDGNDGQPRFRMLETIRAFAYEQLDDSAMSGDIQRRHAEHFASIADTGPYYPQSAQGSWMERLEQDRANVDAALTWASANNPDFALRFAADLWPFWNEYDHGLDGLRWLPATLAAVQAVEPRLHAKALTGWQFLSFGVSNYAQSLEKGQQALDLWLHLDDAHGQALAWLEIGLARTFTGDAAGARIAFASALASFERDGDPRGIAGCLCNIAVSRSFAMDFEGLEPIFQRAEELWRSVSDEIGLARLATERALSAILTGRYSDAIRLCEEGLYYAAREHSAGIRPALEFYLSFMLTITATDRLPEAAALQTRSIHTRWQTGDMQGLSFNILAFGAIAFHQALLHPPGSVARRALAQRAATLAGAGTALQQRHNVFLAGTQAIYESELAAVRDELGLEAFVQAFGRGAGLTAAQAYELALLPVSQ